MVNLGIAGMGYIGRVHLEACGKVPGFQVRAVAALEAEEIRNTFPGLQIYPSYQELFRGERLDAVIICIPTYLHEEATVEAAARGCHILCEKAMALDAGSAKRMVQAAQAHGRCNVINALLMLHLLMC